MMEILLSLEISCLVQLVICRVLLEMFVFQSSGSASYIQNFLYFQENIVLVHKGFKIGAILTYSLSLTDAFPFLARLCVRFCLALI